MSPTGPWLWPPQGCPEPTSGEEIEEKLVPCLNETNSWRENQSKGAPALPTLGTMIMRMSPSSHGLREFTRPQPEPRPPLILTPWEWSLLRSGLWKATGSFGCSPGDASRLTWEPRAVSAQSEAQGNLELRAVMKSIIIYSLDSRVGLSFFHSTG